jgi:hypothetical protein
LIVLVANLPGELDYAAIQRSGTSEAPVMSTPAEPVPRPAPKSSLVRRLVVSVILSGLVVLALWFTVFGIVTSLMVGSGFGVVVIAASATSDLIETVLDAIANMVFAVLAAIAAALAALLSLFGG